jgi:hypothetical protein
MSELLNVQANESRVMNDGQTVMPPASVFTETADAVSRLSLLLVYVAGQNVLKGRDASVISQDLPCGVVARLLRIDMDELETALGRLGACGYIEPMADGGLMLLNLAGLRRLAFQGANGPGMASARHAA